MFGQSFQLQVHAETIFSQNFNEQAILTAVQYSNMIQIEVKNLVQKSKQLFRYLTLAEITKLHFILNLRMDHISWSITLHKVEQLSCDKHSSLLGAFVS